MSATPASAEKVKPLCPAFGICGGCAHQDIPYEEELALKENRLRNLLRPRLGTAETVFDPIVASPKPYHYRSRLDLALLRPRSGKTVIGFMGAGRFRLIPVTSCSIAMDQISRFMPALKEEAERKLRHGYRTANLVVKTGDDGRIFWGGIGRRSLEMKPEDYLWTDAGGTRIFYSLGTFFQANLSILGEVVRRVDGLIDWKSVRVFADLYAGVGFFGISLASKAARVILVEESPESIKLARHNIAYHGLKNVEVAQSRVEDAVAGLLGGEGMEESVCFVDPPRAGLKTGVREALSRAVSSGIFYLSCNPESLAADLETFLDRGWAVRKVIPFDFFPKTAHLETLVFMQRA